MKLLSIDQSFKNTACLVWDAGEIVDHYILHTELLSNTIDRGEKPVDGVTYHKERWQQAAYISDHLMLDCEHYNIDQVCIESVPFGCQGNVAKDLGGLYFTIRVALSKYEVAEYTPTAIKSFAWGKLPKELQYTSEVLKSGKMKKVKMDKKFMIEAIPEVDKHILEGYNLSNGKTDLADAFWCGKLFWSNWCGQGNP